MSYGIKGPFHLIATTPLQRAVIKRILFTVGNVDRDIGRHSGRHSVDIAIDTRSIVGRQSVDTRSTVGRYSGR